MSAPVTSGWMAEGECNVSCIHCASRQEAIIKTYKRAYVSRGKRAGFTATSVNLSTFTVNATERNSGKRNVEFRDFRRGIPRMNGKSNNDLQRSEQDIVASFTTKCPINATWKEELGQEQTDGRRGNFRDRFTYATGHP